MTFKNTFSIKDVGFQGTFHTRQKNETQINGNRKVTKDRQITRQKGRRKEKNIDEFTG